uniref:C2H2-type domain-containing protein n=1 Tax=Leptobrachium leishanense TaxID=445787 RepID=A0A8C5PMZ0_9ANUR
MGLTAGRSKKEKQDRDTEGNPTGDSQDTREQREVLHYLLSPSTRTGRPGKLIMNKDKSWDPLTQRILDLTLEMIFLLIGEDHMVVKIQEMVNENSCHQISEGGYRRSQSFNTEPPPHSGIHEQNNEKILELTNQIIRLLTGEVPIRCEDVTVYLSMEEWAYVERHKELYEDVMLEDHQPVITIDKSVSGESITPASLSGNKSITNNVEQNLNKKTKGRVESATYREQESPASGEEQVTNKSNYSTIKCKEYSPTDIKQEPASCEENLTDCVIYKPIENTSTATGAESDSYGERNITSHDIYPSTEHTQTEYFSTDIKQESPIYKGNLTDRVIYKPTEYTPDNIGEYLTGDTNPLEINHSESLIESRKPDTDLIMYNSVYKDNSVLSSEMGEVSYFESDLVIHGNNCREDAFSPTFCRENPTPVSGLTHQHVYVKEEQFSCPECREQFTDLIALIRHQMIHTGKKSFNCNDCGKCFTQAPSLATHKWVHNKEKGIDCPDCGKCFVSASRLERHKVTHTGVKPFKCTECGKCFRESSSLAEHKRIHTGEKPFKCPECEKCFSRASNLSRHKTVHTGEKPFTCPECEKCFSQASALAQHKRIHTGEKPFKCSECGKTFSRTTILAQHKMIHTGEKPFKCTECGKCFTQASSLYVHKMIHTREKTFQCPECEKCFNHASNLGKHAKTHRRKAS